MNVRSIRLFAASISLALVATSAHAVHISPNGTGQVLLFPYYTVRNGFSTLVSVTNTQNNTKAVKVRFLEGMNGREVSGFNLFLAPNDTWTGVVVETQNGARIVTNDNSCVAPSDLFTETRQISGTVQSFNEFINFRFTGSVQDNPAFSSLDRTREGYFEILEMGLIDPTLSATAAQIVGFVKPADVDRAGTTNCAAVDRFDSSSGTQGAIRFPNTGAALMAPPSGGLKGRASLINAATGANYSFAPTALDGWSSQVAYSPAGDAGGTILSDAFPTSSMVTTPMGVVIARWANGRDAVSAALMRESLLNEFVLDTGTVSQTDWLVTLPTKRFYTDPIYGNTISSVRAPFSGAFSSDGTTGCDGGVGEGFQGKGGAAEDPAIRGEKHGSEFAELDDDVAGTLFDQDAAGFYEVYLYTAASTSKASALTSPAFSGSTQGPNGRATFIFSRPQQQLTPLSAVLISPSGVQTTISGKHIGLPMIGVMLHNYKNADVLSRYGGVVEHAYSVRVE